MYVLICSDDAMHVWRKKDICVFFGLKAYYRHTDLFSTNLFKVGLRKHPDALSTFGLGENNRIFSKPHGTRLESVSIDTNRLYTLRSHFVTVTKAKRKNA